MAEKLLVVILNSDPQNPLEIIEPIYHATIAASMDFQTEIIFSGRAGQLAIKGFAKEINSPRKSDETLEDLIQEAYQSGVVLKVSKFVVQTWGEKLLPEISEVVSGGYIVSELMKDTTITLTY